MEKEACSPPLTTKPKTYYYELNLKMKTLDPKNFILIVVSNYIYARMDN